MGRHHARAIGRLTSATLVGVADPAPDVASAFAEIAPQALVRPSLAALLAEREVDVVHVCTAPASHAAIATEALEAGCHIYVEKPFAESEADAARLLDLARSKGLRVCAGHQLLYEAPTREALALLPALGRIVHVESYFSFLAIKRLPGTRAPLRDDLQLLDILPHPTYVLLHVLEAMRPDGQVALTGVDIGPAGTVHAMVRRGDITGSLVVTLDGRPVESYLRIVGTNGSVYCDFVRGSVQRSLGPGTSGIDKVLNPYRQAWQLAVGTTVALARRLLKKQRSYPGLTEIFGGFYDAVATGAPAPVSPQNIRETVQVCERIARDLRVDEPSDLVLNPARPLAVVTGGTGFLGRHLARTLVAQGFGVRVLARRVPPRWDREPGVDYAVVDLAEGVPADRLRGAEVIYNCAAETAYGWDEHQRNCIDPVDHLVRAAVAAGIRRIVHVSSISVMAEPTRGAQIDEESPLHPNVRDCGPYAWGKLEQERLLLERATAAGIAVKIVRPGALVDYASFDPPGLLGKRVGNVFVAVGSSRETLGTSDVGFTARAMTWLAREFDTTPQVLHTFDPVLPTKGTLVERLRQTNPDLTVVWLPRVLLHPLSWLAIALQKALRPTKPALSVAKIFIRQRFDTRRIATHAAAIDALARTQVRATVPAPTVSAAPMVPTAPAAARGVPAGV